MVRGTETVEPYRVTRETIAMKLERYMRHAIRGNNSFLRPTTYYHTIHYV